MPSKRLKLTQEQVATAKETLDALPGAAPGAAPHPPSRRPFGRSHRQSGAGCSTGGHSREGGAACF